MRDHIIAFVFHMLMEARNTTMEVEMVMLEQQSRRVSDGFRWLESFRLTNSLKIRSRVVTEYFTWACDSNRVLSEDKATKK